MEPEKEVDHENIGMFDELPLWSAPFGLMLLDRVPLRGGLTILDLAAGTGFITIELAQRCADSTVFAVDPWEPAMERLQRKVQHHGLRNVRIITQDAASLDLPDESIDLIVSNLGINNFEKPENVLRSCFRVATPGARFLLTTNLVGHMAEFYEAYRTVLIEFGFADRLAALDAHINHRATVDSVTKQLAASGFEILKVDTASYRQRFADGSTLLSHHLITSGFLPAWKSIVEPNSADIIFAALENRLNELAALHGELSLTIPMACFDARKPMLEAR